MKKIIQFSALLSLMFVFSVVFANAQKQERRIAVQVPCGFRIEQTPYPAGEYRIRIFRLSADAVLISVMDAANKKLQTFIAPGNADVLTDAPYSVINQYRRLRYLGKVRAAADQKPSVAYIAGK